MVEVDLRWPGVPDDEPYLVKFPRVPMVGERIIGPDRMAPLVVVSVTYRYDSGFYFEPSRIVVVASKEETREGE